MYSDDFKHKILARLKETSHIANTCVEFGIPRKTFYEWKRNIEWFGDAVDEIIESQVDFVENALYRNAIEGNVTAQIYYLNNKGRLRGYRSSHVHEHVNPDGSPMHPPAINITVVGPQLAASEDEL